MWSMSRCLLQLYSLVRIVSSAKHLTDNTWIFGQNKYQDTGQESKIWNVKSYMQLASFFSYQFLLSCLDDVKEETRAENSIYVQLSPIYELYLLRILEPYLLVSFLIYFIIQMKIFIEFYFTIKLDSKNDLL